ncbi:MAG: TerB N-terminal domain-containing protein [Thermomicrobiales bacterium]
MPDQWRRWRFGSRSEQLIYVFEDPDEYFFDDDQQQSALAWVGPGQTVEVAGFTLSGSMVYVGEQPDSYSLWYEISAIEPGRRVNTSKPAPADRNIYYWQPYASMTPAERAVYLSWLADGRRTPHVPTGYPSLYLCGLERRVFVDIAGDRTLAWELPLIRNEVAALIETYGTALLYGHASTFLEMLDLMMEEGNGDSVAGVGDPPPLEGNSWQVPTRLAVGLGRLVAARQPIPADWALAWAWYRPDIPLRTAAYHCPEEFQRLFIYRYEQEQGEGLRVRQGRSYLQLEYMPINSALGRMSVDAGRIPDVVMRKAPGEVLGDLVYRVTNELDPYSRWLKRNPQREKSVAALAHLPAPLLETGSGEATVLREWIGRHLGSRRVAVVEPADVLTLWSDAPLEKLTKADALLLGRVLQRFDVGIEPDVRAGGSPVALGKPVVLFRLDDANLPEAPSASYTAATAMALLGAAVLAADGPIPPQRLADLVGLVALSDALPAALSPGEMARLHAYLTALVTRDIKLTGLKKQLDALSDAGREATGDLLIAVATIDGAVSPPTVTVLLKLFKQLGLDQETVTSRLHAAMTGQRPTTAVRQVPANRTGSRGAMALDRSTIDARERETAVVSDLLGSIFADDEAGAPPTSAPPETGSGGDAIAGLDAAHSDLVRALAGQDTWAADEFATLAATYHLLATGAIDLLNETALDLADELLIEGEDPLIINPDILQEILS